MTEPDEYSEKPAAKPAPPPPTEADAEVRAITAAYRALKALDPPALNRALRWLSDRLAADHAKVTDDPWAREEPPF